MSVDITVRDFLGQDREPIILLLRPVRHSLPEQWYGKTMGPDALD